jgi:hypothetical protein
MAKKKLAASPKIEIPITGKVIGYQLKGEKREDAAARILLEAEMQGNNGPSRLHLFPVPDPRQQQVNDDLRFRGGENMTRRPQLAKERQNASTLPRVVSFPTAKELSLTEEEVRTYKEHAQWIQQSAGSTDIVGQPPNRESGRV